MNSMVQPQGITSSCVCVQITNDEAHRAESGVVKNHLQLQPHKPEALHCLGQEFLLPGEALRAMLLCHEMVLALQCKHQKPSMNHKE